MIDLRSDTVTTPTPAMREAMAAADVGDDVYGEDPTVRRLEEAAADRFGKEAGLFVASGTMSNLIALMSHCGRGDEYLVAQGAHTFRYEGGGAAVLGSVQPQPIATGPNGAIAAEQIASEVKKEGDPHFARTRLLALENAYWGRVQTIAEMTGATDCAREHGLATHLDGARIFNATTALQVSAEAIAAPFDSVSVCLSKGLGAPIGSVLVGADALIDRARRWRKVVGGGWRQAGVLAAAGLYALEHHVDRLADDHRRARQLAERLARLDGVEVDLEAVETNMVFVDVVDEDRAPLGEFLQERGVKVGGRGNYRLVMHLGVDDDDVETIAGAFEAWSVGDDAT